MFGQHDLVEKVVGRLKAEARFVGHFPSLLSARYDAIGLEPASHSLLNRASYPF
jgi:hypothetical protein